MTGVIQSFTNEIRVVPAHNYTKHMLWKPNESSCWMPLLNWMLFWMFGLQNLRNFSISWR